MLFRSLDKNYPDAISSYYNTGTGSTSSGAETLNLIAKCRGCIKSGAEPDLDKAGKLLIDDFRTGKLGAITLERS